VALLRQAAAGSRALPGMRGIRALRRAVPRRSASEEPASQPLHCTASHPRRASSGTPPRGHGLYEGSPLLRDQAMLLRKAEVGSAIAIRLQAQPASLVGRQALERYQAVGDIVRALVWREIADEIAAASRNDREPAAGIGKPCV